MEDDFIGEESDDGDGTLTQDKPHNRIKLTFLLILPSWTLRSPIASDFQDQDQDVTRTKMVKIIMLKMMSSTPDGSHGEELASAGLQVGAWTEEPVVPREDSLPHIFLFTVHLIFSIEALEKVVTLELLLQADLLSRPLSTSCSAYQLHPTASNLRSHLDLTGAVDALHIIPRAMCVSPPALSSSVTCASVEALIVTGYLLPKSLVGTHLRVNCLPSGSFASKLIAGAGEGWIAPGARPPGTQKKAVSREILCGF